MRPVIIDTGPLVALLNGRDQHHQWARDLLDTIKPPLLTCESVLSEACFLLGQTPGGAQAVMQLLHRQIVEISFSLREEATRIGQLMKKYDNVPMSLADACLVRMSETHADSQVLTLDEDFRIYRKERRQQIPLLIPSS
jgi:uncharacterized protein